MTYYTRLKDLRADKDLTQKQLSDKLFMHKTTYARYEIGERILPLDVAIKIARFHNVSLDYLAGLSDNRKATSRNPTE